MMADFAINDMIGNNCCVRIDFRNGYSIERFRKYASKGGEYVMLMWMLMM